jgi:glutathione S-transferase
MLDSPYVRRVAISLEFLDIHFEHQAVSVFKTFTQFQSINPVVKAPTLICDDGEVLMDSSLILQFVEATHGKTLWSHNPKQLQHQMRAVSLALAACEKSVQIVYERNLRPETMHFQPWLDRVKGQLLAAYAGLEKAVQMRSEIFAEVKSHAAITSAIAWQFTQSMLAEEVVAGDYPGLVELSERMEKSPEFLKWPPVGPGVPAKSNVMPKMTLIEIIESISQEISWAKRISTYYSELFHKDRDAELEKFADNFFTVLEWEMRESLILKISRLLDPAKDRGGNKNMTLYYLHEEFKKTGNASEVAAAESILITINKKNSDHLKKFRNTVIAHNCLNQKLKSKYVSPDMKIIQNILDDIIQYVKVIRFGINLPEHKFTGPFYEQTGAGTLALRIEEYNKTHRHW